MARHMAPKKRRSKAPLIVVLLLLGAGCAAWLFLAGPLKHVLRPEADAPAATTETKESTQESAATEQADEAMGSDEGWTDTPFTTLVREGQVASIRLVGDSITAGFGTDGYTDPDFARTTQVIYDDGSITHCETDAQADSWANAFRAWAAEHGIEGFVNAGINGAFMAELAHNPDAWLREGADVIVVALGTNDAGYYGPDEYRADAALALASCASRARLVVVLSPVSDLRSEETLVESAASLGDILQQFCAENGYLFVDTRQAVTPEMFCEDGLHPNSVGSHAIWDCLRATLGI